MPLAEAMASPAHIEPPQAGSLDGLETVLVVEDEAPLQMIYEYILKNAGFTVLHATDGQQALDFVRHEGKYAGRTATPISVLTTRMNVLNSLPISLSPICRATPL